MKNSLNNFSLKNKKALIVGGCGLIGEKICESFLSAGSKITVLDFDRKKGNLLKRKFKNYKFTFEFFDLSNLEDLERLEK
jgi:NAD(P)-dependent dehydrogenase (short-subunit alcohol dehydrogenase family)